MAEEAEEQEEKGKGPLLKIILFAVGGLLILILTIVLTLFISGFFDEEPSEEVEETLQQLEEQAEGNKEDKPKQKPEENQDSSDDSESGDEEVVECEEGDEECEANAGAPKKVTREMPEPSAGFVQSYKELSRPLIANLQSSRKVMQITLAVMTQYEEKVLEHVDKHEFALRSVILDIMRQTKEEDITRPDFRVELAERIRLGMNSVLERWENFGGIEEVYFTEFVIQ